MVIRKESKMKRISIVIMLLVFVATVGIAFADTTSGPTYTSPNGNFKDEATFLNKQKAISHTHQCDKQDRDDPYGGGVELIVWENQNKTVAVKAEGKYDMNNEETSAFAVVQINLWEIFSKQKE